MQRDPRIGFKTACFSLLVCQHPETREFLAVDEMSGDGWWLPGGQVCSGETFLQTCHVKALQEAGVEVDVTGILAVEHSITGPKGEEDEARMRVIYFGHPKDSSSKPRNAEWKSIHELEAMAPQLRGRELLEWGKFIEAGGQIAPLEMFQREDHGPCRGLHTWNTPVSSTAFLCPLTWMCREAISKRSVEEFKAILSRVPTLSAALLHKTLKARFGVEASVTDDMTALSSEYAATVYQACQTYSSSLAKLAPGSTTPNARTRTLFDTHGFSVVVCQHPETKKWLAVNESKNRGWWLPAGHVDRGQTFVEAASRETEEEAGLSVKITGLLAVERTLQGPEKKARAARMRVIFLASPTDPSALPKSVPDKESNGAAWMTTQELASLAGLPPPKGLRGAELLEWGSHLEQGGTVFPVSMLQEESQGPCKARWEHLEQLKRG